MKCRFCHEALIEEFIDLVHAPLSNAYLNATQLNEPEIFYPLRLWVCGTCMLVQVDEYKKSQEIFNRDYAYFSSFSKSWLRHSELYTHMMIQRFGLSGSSLVCEIASNDGYLLQYFKKNHVPCFGIEPTANTAAAARKKGIEVIEEYFGTGLAEKLLKEGRKKPDVILGNNVLAHVPDLNDFVRGLKNFLSDRGIITMEFPHLMELIEKNQFDTIYHEHFSYFSFLTVQQVFASHGLTVFDVERLATHGGSLRIFAGHDSDCGTIHQIHSRVRELLDEEKRKGMDEIGYYKNFQQQADVVKYNLLAFLLEQARGGKKIAAYGAAAKGNTLLNYCGVKTDFIAFAVDASPHKQGKYMPGSHILITDETRIKKEKPDFILILPWNIREEITSQLSYIRQWGGKFIVPIPQLEIF